MTDAQISETRGMTPLVDGRLVLVQPQVYLLNPIRRTTH